MTGVPRYRLDDLRRVAAALVAGVGVPPARASALAAQRLWFDAVGAPRFGIQTIPDWLERITSREIDPTAEGRVTSERSGTAVFDGQNGVPPLILARGAELALEKARDAGVGLVRVANIGEPGPGAEIVAEMAVGPVLGFVLGPGPRWSMALPSEEGLPAVFDSAFGEPPVAVPSGIAPWWVMLAPERGWLIGAAAVPALEPLDEFRRRVSAELVERGRTAGVLTPRLWEDRRREAREMGVPIASETWAKFRPWAARFGVTIPESDPLPG